MRLKLHESCMKIEHAQLHESCIVWTQPKTCYLFGYETYKYFENSMKLYRSACT